MSVLGFIVLLSVPTFVYYTEATKYDMGRAFFEASKVIEELPSDEKVYSSIEGKLVHFSSDKVKATEILHDPDLGIEAHSALRMKRVTEFCQWQEFHTDKKRDDGSTERTYYYVKGWRSYPIISAFFDQPFAHNNPQRDPFPSFHLTANNMQAGAFTITKPLIENLPYSHTVRDFSNQDFARFHGSPSMNHGFKYVGDGYFYSPYEESTAHTFFKLAGQYMEGSLLDFQIGDLFSQCSAGDIRIHYEVAAPSSVSAMGKQAGNKLVPFVTSNQFIIALLHNGVVSAHQMFDVELQNQQMLLYVARLLLALWGIGVATVLLGIHPWQPKLLAALFLMGIVVGGTWCVVWGTFTSFVLAMISAAGLFVVNSTTPKMFIRPPPQEPMKEKQ